MGRIIGPSSTQLTLASGVVAIAVNATANVLTASKNINSGTNFSLSIKATVASGTPDLDIYLQQSFQRPATEGSADATWVIPEGISKILDITDELWHHIALSPVVLPFLRLLIDGQGSNPSTCVISARLNTQEET